MRVRKSFSVNELVKMSEALGINVNLLCTGRVDYEAVAEQYFNQKKVFPFRYSVSEEKLGRARGIQVILKYLSGYWGPVFAKRVLSRLQLHSESFMDPCEFIHPGIYFDLFHELSSEGFTLEQFAAIGKASLKFGSTGIDTLLSEKKDPQSLYTAVHEEVFPKFYDRCFEYLPQKISSDETVAKIVVSEEAKDRFHTHVFG